eukprot:11248443-Alexandrium_andersonii.AAC.1
MLPRRAVSHDCRPPAHQNESETPRSTAHRDKRARGVLRSQPPPCRGCSNNPSPPRPLVAPPAELRVHIW